MEPEIAFLLLGPLAVRAGASVLPVPPGKQRALLAALLMSANQMVSRDELAEAMWGGQPPRTARVTLHNYVKLLRKTLAVTGESRIRTLPDGYLISVSSGELDVLRFEALQDRARDAAQEGAWARAAQDLREALSLWRGEALADVPSELLVLREVPRLAEMRLQAVEGCVDAELRLGRHGEVIAELRRLTAVHPLREKLHALLMLALYRNGQQGEALAAFRQVRHVLAQELGVEPGSELQQLERQILTADPALAAPVPVFTDTPTGPSPRMEAPQHELLVLEPPPAPEAGGGSQPAGTATGGVRFGLPPDAVAFTGRDGELEVITSAVARAAVAGGVVGIHAIGGMPGVGKTALAVHAAHRLKDRFPGRQLFIDLHGHTPRQEPMSPEAALASLLTAVGVDARSLPADLAGRAGLWRQTVAGQRALLVLDNAASSAQVTSLLPGGDGCLVLVTSRRHLGDLPGPVTVVPVDALAPDQAREMFIRLAPRAAAESAAAVDEVVRLAEGLPLAISLLARVFARHLSWTLADLAAETRAGVLTLTAEEQSVAAAFGLSYRYLAPARQRFFRRLGLHPGVTIDAHAAAVLADVQLAEATGLLDALHGEGLLTEVSYRRYGMHDLILRYARDLAAEDPIGASEQALGRLLDYYQHAAATAQALLARQSRTSPRAAGTAVPVAVPPMTDRERALAWARAERGNLLACLDHATRAGQHARVIALTAGLAGLLRQDGPWAEAITRHEAAVRAARRLGDRLGEAGALTDLGFVRQLTRDYPGAAGTLGEALGIFRDLGERLGEAGALTDLGAVRWLTGDYPGATRELEEALGIFRDLGDRLGQGNALSELGVVRRMTGDYPGATRELEEALGISRDLGDRGGEAVVLNETGALYRVRGDLDQAFERYRQALDLARQIGSSQDEACALAGLGRCAQAAGDTASAIAGFRQAQEIFHRIGAAEASDVAAELSALTQARPPAQAR